ncbi:MAG: TIR domain-containing protein [Lachnospira sp.]
MSVFKCKMCGGALEINANETTATCEYCGTMQTLPKLDNERKANLYDRANHFRRSNDYDKAMSIYEQILNEDHTDAEAYWSIVLCRYGIEYVEDPVSHKRVPTVNRAQFTSIHADEDYKAALQYADLSQKSIYETEAKAIDEIQKGILAISQKEEPFDVFICYKETDSDGRRTQDSVLANDLYHQLTQEGFKVFFARITLEDKLGSAYEPYIFAALNSAKAMVVLGTKPEFFNAVWVKNEWSRYLSLIKGGEKKVLIPAYRDMDPYDLPEEFSHLQAQDMSKLGFMQDLIRGIKKILAVDKPKAMVKETIINKTSSSNVENLLKRGMLSLEDKKWDEADRFFEQVLNENVEEPRAYLGKMLCSLRVASEEKLIEAALMNAKPLTKNDFYIKAFRFANDEYKTHLIDLNNKFVFSSGMKTFNSSKTENDYLTAKAIFDQIPDYQKAKEKSDECQQLANESAYSNAMQYLNSAKAENYFLLAKEIFDRIPDYKDSKEKANECIEGAYECVYCEAETILSESEDISQLTSAKNKFKKISEYKDASEKAAQCEQKIAQINDKLDRQIFLARKRKIRRKIILSLSPVLIVAFLVLLFAFIIPTINYNKAVSLMNNGEYTEAISIFRKTKRYYNSKELWMKCSSFLSDSTLSVGDMHTVALKADGTVVATGYNNQGQCDVSEWKDIVAVSAGAEHTVGLKRDGTVVATGCNSAGQCDVSDWKDIVAVSAGGSHTVGLKKDGTVVAIGGNSIKQCNEWTDIVAISVGSNHTIGIKDDGTVVATGSNYYGQCNLSNWKDIILVSAGEEYTIGLKSDSTIVTKGNNLFGISKLLNWQNIEDCAAGANHIVCLTSHGTVVEVGSNNYGQCNVSDWSNIVAVSAGRYHTVGLKADGTVISTGDNTYGQCNTSEWTNIKTKIQ